MNMNSYILSFTKKIDRLFWNKEIINIIYLHDKQDNERLDQVIYLEESNGSVIGLYINGMNPVFSLNKIHNFDEFNLFASYDALNECKEGKFLKFKISHIKLIFNTQYNELFGLYLSSVNESNSIMLLFMQNVIHIELGCKKTEIMKVLEENISHITTNQYLVYEKDIINNQWHQS